MKSIRASLVLLLASPWGAPAWAQASPAESEIAHRASASQDQQLADYLALLRGIAPAAEEAARTYVAAVRLKCGHALDMATLRQAMAREGGDAILMGLIRAAATQDATARYRLIAQMRCGAQEAQ